MVCDKEDPKQNKSKPTEMPTKNNDNLWDRKKMTVSSRKAVMFLLLHITHWSLPRFSTR